MIRALTEVFHLGENAGMPAFDGAILESVQIFHGGVFDDLFCDNEQKVGRSTLR
jgi:hypothetical protein